MKNNKGFAISSVIYAMLVLFLGLVLLILGNLASRKAMFDKEKNEILMRFNGDESGVVTYENGSEVYFNVTTGTSCSPLDYTEAQSNTGVKEGCMKFYAFNDDGGDTVNLILDHNTTATIAWNSIGSNASGPSTTFLNQLKSDTSSWKGTQTPTNYTMDQTGQTSNAKYTIDYSGYKARLITANEVARITGNISWDEKTATGNYYFDSQKDTASDTCKYGNTTGCQYGWLYDRAYTNCTTYGCLNNSNKTTYGYWTASSRAGNTNVAWIVFYTADMGNGYVSNSGYNGIRPVITVLKSKLSKKYINGEEVYFNVDTGNGCTSSDYTQTQSNTGVKTGCMKFYAFNDDGGDTLNLLLDHNTTDEVYWNSSGSNASGPNEVLKQLQTDTSSWVGTETPSNYTNYDGTTAKYTIDYSSYKARLITANEIATITNYTGWDEKLSTSSSYYFHTNTKTQYTGTAGTNKYAWLFDNTESCTEYGCNVADSSWGYRTASALASSSTSAWIVYRDGNIDIADVNSPSGSGAPAGVRPVITVLKSKLKKEEPKTYKITYNLTNVSGNKNNATSIKNLETRKLLFGPNNGYSLPESITVSGATYTWDKASGALVLLRATGDVTITINGVKTYTNGEIVYFNVTTGTKCSSSNYTTTQSNIGTKSGCMKFYAFNDDGGSTINLILDHNTTALVAWNKTYKNDSGSITNAKGPKEVLDQLKTDTSSWKGTITPSNYTMDQTGQTSNAKYTIDYSGYKARLITANEIAQITGNTTWDEKVSASKNYYFDSKTTSASTTCKGGNTSGCKFGWLYDRTSKSCTEYGCLNNSDQATSGYWTVSSRAVDSNYAWNVSYNAYVDSTSVVYSGSYGVRPVITVLKSKLA